MEQIFIYSNIKNDTKLEINEESIRYLTIDFIEYFSNKDDSSFEILKNNLFCFLGITESILNNNTIVGVGYGVVFSIVENYLLDKFTEKYQAINPEKNNLASSSSMASPESISNFIVMETLDNGNCFYSSIYRAAKHNNLLEKIFDCIPELNSLTENNFIKKFRNYVSNDITNKIEGMFYYLENLIANYDTDNFDAIINKIGDIKDTMIEYKDYELFSPEYLDDFMIDIKKIMKTDRKYVGQLEVEFIKEKLENCGIYIKIFYEKESAIEKMTEDIVSNFYRNTLYFINQREVHYEYIVEDDE